jgi:hypothetical protein
MAKRQTPSPVARFVRELVYGREPIGAEDIGVLAGYNQRGLGHQLGSTIAHYGMRGDPALTFAGYVSSPQEFIGAAQMGANKHVTVEEYPALPNSAAPPALPAVQALLDPFSQESLEGGY